MASTKAVHERFGRLDPYELARKELFAEGISSSKIYLDPLRPALEDLLDMITSGVRSSFTYAGASHGRRVPRARARRPAVRRRLRRGQGAAGQLVIGDGCRSASSAIRPQILGDLIPDSQQILARHAAKWYRGVVAC